MYPSGLLRRKSSKHILKINSNHDYSIIKKELNHERYLLRAYKYPHLRLNDLTLKNQISRNQMILGDKESRIQAYKSYNKYKGDLLRIEKILNGNIYFDEAMEVYIYQKVQCLYRDVEEILTNSNPKQATKKS